MDRHRYLAWLSPLLLLPLLLPTAAGNCDYLSRIPILKSIAENATIGDLIILVPENETDLRAQTFKINQARPTPFPFQYLDTEKAMNLTTTLDREQVATYTVILECWNGGAKRLERTFIISVSDIDDTSPVWVSPGHYSANLKEGNLVGTLLTFNSPRPQITDEDSTLSQTFHMGIVTGPFSDYFNITNPATTRPDIKVLKILDYEDRNLFNISLLFEDRDMTGTLMFNGTAPLVINVEDVEDETPQFGQNKYWAVVVANATKGRVIALQPETLKAVDGDSSINATINYALLTGSIVDVNATTGQLSLNQDNPEPRTYAVYVKAFEVERPKREKFVRVEINITSSSLLPVCRHAVQAVAVSENTQVGATITNVDVNYPYPSQLTFKILTQAAVFSVSGKSLLLRQLLDYEATKQYDVSVEVTNGAASKVTCLVRVNVTNYNDHTPTFEKAAYEFKNENSAFGVKVGIVKAVDGDAGTSLTYSLKSQQTLFAIDRASGTITINTTAGFTERSYSFIVVATDDGQPRLHGEVLVTVTTDPTAAVSGANSLVIAMAALGGLLVFVLVVAGIIFFLYRKRSQKPSQNSAENQNGHTANLYYYENRAGPEPATAWTNMPSPLEAMYKEYSIKDQTQADASGSQDDAGTAAAERDEDGPCINLGIEYSTGPGSIRSVVSGKSRAGTSLSQRHRIVPTPVVDSPAELSEVEGSIESYSIAHDDTSPPPPPTQSPQPRLDNMTFFL